MFLEISFLLLSIFFFCDPYDLNVSVFDVVPQLLKLSSLGFILFFFGWGARRPG